MQARFKILARTSGAKPNILQEWHLNSQACLFLEAYSKEVEMPELFWQCIKQRVKRIRDADILNAFIISHQEIGICTLYERPEGIPSLKQ